MVIDRPRNRDPLTLSAGQQKAGFADAGLVTQWQALDELRGVGRARRPYHPLGIRLLSAKSDVLRDRRVEHVILLQHDADVATEIAQVQAGQLPTVVEDCSPGRFEQSAQALDERGFAGTASADDANPGAGPHLEIDRVENSCLSRPGILETQVLELNMARNVFHWRQSRMIRTLLGRPLEHIVEATE